ncbi:MAG: sigma 54-interacting transcriptional regulator [Desulfatitalea sp.]|nr:sigma 54-interacting transcriptional regulator [Desulfatitalea sp.]
MRKFKELLFNFSARLISVSPDQISREIETGLKLIGEFWAFDRIALAEFDELKKSTKLTHAYTASGAPGVLLERIDEDIPWIIESLSRGDAVVLDRIPDDLPQEAEVDRIYCEKEGLKSAFALPLKIGAHILGGCFFHTLHKYYHFTKDMTQELGYLVEILASALERERAARQIHNLLQFELFLSEVSATYINIHRNVLDSVIKSDLGKLGRLLEADRCLFYSADPDPGVKRFMFSLAYAWWPRSDNKEMIEIFKWREQHPNFLDDFQFFADRLHAGEIFHFEKIDDLPEEAAAIKAIYTNIGIKSVIAIPVSVAETIMGALVIVTTRGNRSWPEDLVPRLRLFGEVFANAIIRKQNEEAIDIALSEIKDLKGQLETDYHYLTEEIELEHNYGDIVGHSRSFQQILLKVEQVAPTNTPVLLLGETGTGKGLIARSIHNAGGHSNRPLVQLNCAALSPSLIESELFGHEKGAFSGAVSQRIGRFEMAHGTTLFLDEIGELPIDLQSKLLRVLQDGEFERVGGNRTIKADVRVIAATNRDLEKEVENGNFRPDLWYRLSVFPIMVPPLRERIEDIPYFVNFFVEKYGKWIGKKFNKIPKKMITGLEKYHWPGNIRELENLIERAVITSPEGKLRIEIPAHTGPAPQDDMLTLQEVERRHIFKVLEKFNWVIEGSAGAARQLGLHPSTLRFRMKKLNIERPLSSK